MVTNLKQEQDQDELFVDRLKKLEAIPDNILEQFQFSMPWQYGDSSASKDEDGFTTITNEKGDSVLTRFALQQECWNKVNQNPFLNTSVRGSVGRKVGWGFETTSKIWEIQEKIDQIELDHRNRLYNFYPKYEGRFDIEGEGFYSLTPWLDGFVEVDFIDPGTIYDGGDDDTGIIFHPYKATMPLFYNIKVGNEIIQCPSIYVARYPNLVASVVKHKDYDRSKQQQCRDGKHKYRVFGGYSRFIVARDKGFVTRRAVSYLRTTLQWLNHYENLKKYEIDHKKSSGAYLWVFSFDELKDFRLWMAMTDEQRKNTGIMQKKTPGSSLVLPPGMKAEVINPKLPTLSGEDRDIKEMIAAGQNEPTDIMTGTSDGNRASVTATRGPMSDRTSDDLSYFDRFLKYDFWSSIFFLAGALEAFPKTFPKTVGTHFKNKKVQTKIVKLPPERFVDISYPVSETLDLEGKARAISGVKHGSMNKQLGIPNKKLAKTIGFGGYGRDRLDSAVEDEEYPELENSVDMESTQEKKLEPSKTIKKITKKE